MIDLGDLGRRPAGAYRLKPRDLLALELGVVRDDGRGRPAFRGSLFCRGEIDGREQQFLLNGGQADQAGDRGAQRERAVHESGSSPWFSGLPAVNFRTPSTTMVILRKPSVCRRVSHPARPTRLSWSAPPKSDTSLLAWPRHSS